MLQPGLLTSGGILETHKLGNAIQEYGVPMVFHNASGPVGFYANVHCAAATENFLALEHHAVDRPEWGDVVSNIKPILDKGDVNVPNGPGLGITLNEDAIRKNFQNGPGYFEPTPQWTRQQMNPGRSGTWRSGSPGTWHAGNSGTFRTTGAKRFAAKGRPQSTMVCPTTSGLTRVHTGMKLN